MTRTEAWRNNDIGQKKRRLRQNRAARKKRPRHSYYNADTGDFKLLQFCVAKADATNVYGNAAVPAAVHFVNCAKDVIPSPVRGFLGRSEKLAPTQQSPPMESAFSFIDTFESDVYKKVAALAFRGEYTDPLSSLRRQFY